MDENSEGEKHLSGKLIYHSSMSEEEDRKEREEINNLRRLLMEDFNMFLLNNILMSVQFFKNYDREILEVRNTSLNEKLIDDDFQSFEADTLYELVSNNVTFERKSDSVKEVTVLHPLRTYVTYRNVDVTWSSSNTLALPQKNNYKLTAQRCDDDRKDAAGYVNLIQHTLPDERFETPLGRNLIQHPNNNLQTLKSGVDKKRVLHADMLVSKNDNFYILEPGRRSKPYSLQIYRTEEKITSPSCLPKSCFKEKQMLAKQKRRVGCLQIKQPNQNIQKSLLLSAAFKRHFSEVFISHLSSKMGYGNIKLDDMTFHLDHIVIKKKNSLHHIIPVLEMKSLSDETKFFYQTIKPVSILWPPKSVENTIKNIGLYFVPIGYHEASEVDNDYTLEWKMEFPKAEKYLTMHMLHTHIRCYLFALILYKSYIYSESSSTSFGPSHILNQLLLMTRKDCLSWPEYSQGVTLLKFLKNLNFTLQMKNLKSFFLQQRNLYDNSPLKVTHKAQAIIQRIIQNPIPYILKALMNLKYRDEFYPKLDYMRLYNILKVKDVMKYLYPSAPEKLKGRNKKNAVPPPVIEKKTIEEEEVLLPQNTLTVRTEILKMFINHFIDIANHSRQYEWYSYSKLYLVHAKRLTVILKQDQESKGQSARMGDIQEFTERITNSMNHNKKHTYKNAAPMNTSNVTNKPFLKQAGYHRDSKAIEEIDINNESTEDDVVHL